MTEYAIIHAGPAVEHLKFLVHALDCVGVREKYFMGDLIETLRYDEDFEVTLNEMTVEMLYGQYFHRQVADVLLYGLDSIDKDMASDFLQVTAQVSEQVAKYLHQTLVTQGRYDHNGKFPYEFDSFNGRLICLRHI